MFFMILQNYPKAAEVLLGSWTGITEHGQDLHESWVPSKNWLQFMSLPFSAIHLGLIPHRQGHLCPQAAIELAKVLLRVFARQVENIDKTTNLNKIKQVLDFEHELWKLCDAPAWDVLTSPGSGKWEGSNPGKFQAEWSLEEQRQNKYKASQKTQQVITPRHTEIHQVAKQC